MIDLVLSTNFYLSNYYLYLILQNRYKINFKMLGLQSDLEKGQNFNKLINHPPTLSRENYYALG
jgi:hypothetical protein